VKPPRKLVFLGYAMTLFVADRNDGPEPLGYTFPKKGQGLFTNPAGSVLWLLPLETRTDYVLPRGMKKEKRAYRAWHDFEPHEMFKLSVSTATATVRRNGCAVQIIYESDKWERRLNSYFHDFSKRNPPPVFMGPRAKVFAIGEPGGKRIVKPEGIVG